MDRDRRPMLLFLLCSGFLLLIVAAVGPFVRTRPTELVKPDAPTEPDEADDAADSRPPPPWERAISLERFLRDRGVAVTVIPCADRPDAWYVFDGEPDPGVVKGVPATAEYADCWRGVALVQVGPWTQKAYSGPRILVLPRVW
jgi:hypothetical protein